MYTFESYMYEFHLFYSKGQRIACTLHMHTHRVGGATQLLAKSLYLTEHQQQLECPLDKIKFILYRPTRFLSRVSIMTLFEQSKLFS